MTHLSGREWTAIVVGFVAFVGGVVLGAVMYAREALPVWGGWAISLVAILGLVLMVATTVRATLRGDTEGVERQDAGAAAMVAVLFIVVVGFSYSLLEAFVGLPRVTAAVPAALAGLVWMLLFAWRQHENEVQ